VSWSLPLVGDPLRLHCYGYHLLEEAARGLSVSLMGFETNEHESVG
jgi:hypothetical protein